MRILLSASLFLLSNSVWSACNFKTHVKKVYSLSGVTSVLFRELGLLNNPVVKGISVFNPIAKEEFSGKRYPGGIFLSRSTFQEFGGGVIFFDESRELDKVLSPLSSIQGVQIKTRGLVPLKVIDTVLNDLNPFLDGCELAIKSLKDKANQLSDRLLKDMPSNRSVVYYLGGAGPSKSPEMVIVEDGIVKWLKDLKKIQTYPSPLAYVNWSKKVIDSMPKKTLHIIVRDSGSEMKKDVSKKDKFWILTYPGSLVPGLTQIEAWSYFEEMSGP